MSQQSICTADILCNEECETTFSYGFDFVIAKRVLRYSPAILERRPTLASAVEAVAAWALIVNSTHSNNSRVYSLATF